MATKKKPAPTPSAPLSITFDMSITEAHSLDRCVIKHGHLVTASPPFTARDDGDSHLSRDPEDEFLGEILGVEEGRLLLFRRRDPDACPAHFGWRPTLGRQYIVFRFSESDDGDASAELLADDSAEAVDDAMRQIYRRYRPNRTYTRTAETLGLRACPSNHPPPC
ncbi:MULTISPECIES: hypothetical protein [unclassified Methylobacterium]|uniref:hypothetical protein n=1 Tax=unclassified Methylobacterium TaxID=2615210 RepID=UPI0006F3BBC2|nr:MULTISPECIES: hypothetical protein [unclassified Methylobacterium]KQP15486.1 hypothetical protein ASF26_17360 [Methylobacterium sp. Leaf93]TXN31779.1 hypothetical protein FV225_19850 [Methylobacterium sp. WL93]TXN44450.1 hypothetical protein FV227_26600 [Methylobacterium sp. WL119]TXN62530.1 hypothetical protein FV232_25295 [Methylobacterium sp. WL30]